MENGYSICLNKWALDKEIKNELGLLLIISSLCAKEGYCFASNSFLAEQFNLSEQSVSDKIKKLERKNYIEIEYEKRGCEIISRKLRLRKNCIDDKTKIVSTIKQNAKDNNISINNNNNKKEIYKESYFNSEILDKAIKEWLEYKNERKDKPYTEIGLKKLLTQIKNNVNEYGEQQVVNLIDECMGNNYKGIIFDKLKKQSKKEDDIVEWF